MTSVCNNDTKRNLGQHLMQLFSSHKTTIRRGNTEIATPRVPTPTFSSGNTLKGISKCTRNVVGAMPLSRLWLGFISFFFFFLSLHYKSLGFRLCKPFRNLPISVREWGQAQSHTHASTPTQCRQLLSLLATGPPDATVQDPNKGKTNMTIIYKKDETMTNKEHVNEKNRKEIHTEINK